MKKGIKTIALFLVILSSIFLVTGCEKDGGTSGGKKVELENAKVTYTYPWSTQIWKNFEVTIGYPKNDNWVAEKDDDDLILKDETRKLEIEFKVDQISKATWEQNSNQRKESMNGSDGKWGEYEGIYYTIANNTYNGWLYLGNPTSIEDGKKGEHVNKLEFKIQSKGDVIKSVDELIKIMDEDILPNISWKEITE